MTAMDIPFHRASITDRDLEAVRETLEGGWLTMGPRVTEFEQRFARAVGATHAVAVNSCTAALHLCLEGLGVGAGDEVIVPAMTFTATAAVVAHAGATPVLVDVEPDTLNIDVESVANAISPRTQVIMPVHYAGQPVDLDVLRDVAAPHDVRIVEDSAHCFPGTLGGRPIGSIGDATCFSFYANKTITTGEGGMITTEDEVLAERARVMRLHGMSKDSWNRFAGGPPTYDVGALGFKYNLTDPAAALGLGQLDRAEELRDQRSKHARRYLEVLADVPGVRPLDVRPGREHSWHLMVVRVSAPFSLSRDELDAGLRARGIGTSIHYKPLHRHSYYRETYGVTDDRFPVASQAADEILSLPLYPDMDDDAPERVVNAIRSLGGV